MTMLLPLALLAAQTAPAAAPPRCDSVRVAMPASLAGWSDIASAPTIGKAFTVSAADPTTVHGLRTSELTRAGGAALVPFEISEDATYHVAVSDRAWVDVAAGNSVIRSSAHVHGPACSGIAKVVDFPLKRGRYALHLTGISAPSVKVLIARI
ncbi:MAG: hypothetical protein ACTHM0_12075 [Sphingomonas sp.]